MGKRRGTPDGEFDQIIRSAERGEFQVLWEKKKKKRQAIWVQDLSSGKGIENTLRGVVHCQWGRGKDIMMGRKERRIN